MDIIKRIDFLLKETTVTSGIAKNTAKGYVDVIGTPKRDGSGKGVRANKGRGGCKKKKSVLTGQNML